MASTRNEQVKRYLNDKFKMQDNMKLRPVLDMLLNHNSVRQVRQKPVVLEWINSDGNDGGGVQNNNNHATDDNISSNSIQTSSYDVYDAYDAKKSPDNQCESPGSLDKNSECRPVATSYTSYASDSKKKVEDFFHDNPSLVYKPLPPHSLEQSPCYPIIGVNPKRRTYYCKVHRKESENIHLESVEHHCKYKEPDVHKKEILHRLSLMQKDNATETEDKNKIIAQFVKENGIDNAIKELWADIGE